MPSSPLHQALALVVATGIMLATSLVAIAQVQSRVEIWKSPYCGCCTKWVDKMKAAGFEVRIHNTDNLSAIKRLHAVPEKLRSCHTAKVGGYVVEGHVPIADVLRLLSERPKVIGISVPGMPIGSPGMEVPSGEKEPYDVLTFNAQGTTRVFAKHE
ncbi:MAG: DUF411 domain-containing protein [Hyphomicrobiaceae bacterium]